MELDNRLAQGYTAASPASMPAGLAPYSRGRQVGAPESEPLTTAHGAQLLAGGIPVGFSDIPQKNLIPDRTCLQPSAPPPDGGGDGRRAPPYTACASHDSYSSHNYTAPDYTRQDSACSRRSSESTDTRCPTCAGPTGAPPAYEESLQHPVHELPH